MTYIFVFIKYVPLYYHIPQKFAKSCDFYTINEYVFIELTEKILLFKERYMDFSQAQEMLKLQQEAMKIKKELENTLIESEVGGLVITVNGEMKVEKAEFEGTELIPWLSDAQKTALEQAIMEAINKGVKKSQEVATEKMKWVMWKMGLNMPGGLGM